LLRLLKASGGSSLAAASSSGSSRGGQGPDDCQDVYTFDGKDQYYLFGTLDRALLTLYVCVTDGCGDVVQPMVHQTPWVILYWYGFVFVTSFGLVNVMVGLFCENVFEKAEQTEKEFAESDRIRKLNKLKKLAEVFGEMDSDGNHSISVEEYKYALENNLAVRELLSELDLADVDLFGILDVDQSGLLDMDEFFNGAMLLITGNEAAKGKDSIPSLLLSQAVYKTVADLNEQVGQMKDDIKALSSHVGVSSNGNGARTSLIAPPPGLPPTGMEAFNSSKSCQSPVASDLEEAKSFYARLDAKIDNMFGQMKAEIKADIKDLRMRIDELGAQVPPRYTIGTMA
jgi:Ca2+-binding EF-hand superfamily protein